MNFFENMRKPDPWLDMKYKFENPPLAYAYDALEPYIDAQTMHLHHDKHLQTYIDNLNGIVERNPALKQKNLTELVSEADFLGLSPDERTALINNGGGVYNHFFYFNGLSPDAPKTPVGTLAQEINGNFGSFENFRSGFKKQALSVFGSGYCWLVLTPFCRLSIITTANQLTPLPGNGCPLICIDVWEHAYYLKYFNVRADYVENLFNVINWQKAEERFLKCTERFSCG